MNDEIELFEGDYQLLSSDLSEEREKELADQGIILNYKVVSNLNDPRSDGEKIMAHHNNQRARYNLNKVLVPLLIDSVKKGKTQDTIGNAKTKYLVTAVQGALVEEHLAKRNAKKFLS